MKKNNSTSSTELERAASEAIRLIGDAASKATATIATAALEATKLLASNAADASKVVETKNASDHDLLVKLDTKMEDLKLAVNKIVEKEDSHVTKPDFTEHLKTDVDHETRIRILEASMWKWLGISSVIAVVISIGATYVLKVVK